MNKVKGIIFFGLISICFLTTGCASTNVKRVPVDQKIDMSGRWNDTDASIIAESMLKDLFNQDWQPLFLGQRNRPPVVIVGEIVNQSHEHINTEVFTKAIERTLINSGKVKFVASKTERPGVREERADQQTNSSAATRKKLANETGADYMLIGSLNSVKDERKGRYVMMYQVNLELIDLETNEKVWIGEESIKKVVEKSKYSL